MTTSDQDAEGAQREGRTDLGQGDDRQFRDNGIHGQGVAITALPVLLGRGLTGFTPQPRPHGVVFFFFLWPRIFNFFNIRVSDVNTACSDVTRDPRRPRPSTCGWTDGWIYSMGDDLRWPMTTLRERDLKVDVITPCHVARWQPSGPSGARDNYQSTMWVGPLQKVGVPWHLWPRPLRCCHMDHC
uniref:uncharacterized protein LOC143314044 isoform X2 n=1 Tax=Arvicanthis niloticus TaxID=61156 RepID=UPI00402B9D6E